MARKIVFKGLRMRMVKIIRKCIASGKESSLCDIFIYMWWRLDISCSNDAKWPEVKYSLRLFLPFLFFMNIFYWPSVPLYCWQCNNCSKSSALQTNYIWLERKGISKWDYVIKFMWYIFKLDVHNLYHEVLLISDNIT